MGCSECTFLFYLHLLKLLVSMGGPHKKCCCFPRDCLSHDKVYSIGKICMDTERKQGIIFLADRDQENEEGPLIHFEMQN